MHMELTELIRSGSAIMLLLIVDGIYVAVAFRLPLGSVLIAFSLQSAFSPRSLSMASTLKGGC